MAARATVTPCSSSSSSSSNLYIHSHNDHVHILYVGGWSGGQSSASLEPGASPHLATSSANFPTTFAWRVAITESGRYFFSIVAAHVGAIFATMKTSQLRKRGLLTLSTELQTGASVCSSVRFHASAHSSEFVCFAPHRRRSST
jgi:hypothetical protein